MIVILDGAENSGKSTLLKNLQTWLTPVPYLVLKFSNIKNIPSDIHKKLFTDIVHQTFNLFQSNQNLILDRFTLSEYTLAPIYRNYEATDLLNIEKSYIAQFPKIADKINLITLVDTATKLMKRDDGLSLFSNLSEKEQIANIEREKNYYLHFFKKSPVNKKLLLHIENKGIFEVFEEVKAFLIKNNKEELQDARII